MKSLYEIYFKYKKNKQFENKRDTLWEQQA